ncbi:HDOD domain-containing protein, partial [Candidatus Falkowbacteria bacterium]|nr:HDOD domain-containing protein [Candidatus Falkowbacteria bacterium]
PTATFPIIEMIFSQKTDDLSFDLVAEKIEKTASAGLIANLIKVASSLTRSNQVNSVKDAATRLGLKGIGKLILSIEMMRIFTEKRNSAIEEMMWKESFTAAVCSKILAERCSSEKGKAKKDLVNRVFTSCLLAHVGMIILLDFEEEPYLRILENAYFDFDDISEMEIKKYGITHARLAHDIMSIWNFPSSFTFNVLCHDGVPKDFEASEAQEQEAAIVHTACLIGFMFATENLFLKNRIIDKCSAHFGLDPVEVEEILRRAKGEIDNAVVSFGVPAPDVNDYKHIKLGAEKGIDNDNVHQSRMIKVILGSRAYNIEPNFSIRAFFRKSNGKTARTEREGEKCYLFFSDKLLCNNCPIKRIAKWESMTTAQALKTGGVAMAPCREIFMLPDNRYRQKIGKMTIDLLDNAEEEKDPFKGDNMNAIEERLQLADWVRMIAHDFNNILTVISNHTQIIMLRTDEQPQIFDSAKKIANMVDIAAIMTSRIARTGDEQPESRQVIDPGELLGEMEDEFQLLTKGIQNKTSFRVTNDASLARLYADPLAIRRILMNLVINAQQSFPDEQKGEIFIMIGEEGEKIIITVSDNGPGIPDEIKPLIFDKRFTTKPEGSGLGLYIVKDEVERLGGSITCASLVGRGTTFNITIPIITQD